MNTEYSEYGNVKNVLESFPIFFFLFFFFQGQFEYQEKSQN